ncbi:MAG: JmjC domain-containing protein [Bdellovibrionales bacterium]
MEQRLKIKNFNTILIPYQFDGWDESSNLNFLIEEIGLKTFLSKYLGKKFLHLRTNNLSWFSNLFTFEKMVEFLTDSSMHPKNFQLYDKFSKKLERTILTRTQGKKNQVNKVQLLKILKKDKGSIAVNHLNNSNLQIHDLANQFTDWTHSRCGVNAYWTPANGKTFGWHWDTHDFFILQIEGEKKWELFEPVIKFPLDDLNFNFANWPEEKLNRTKKKAELILKAGDVLYVPAGTPHDVTALANKDSMHLTVSLSSGTWLDAFEKFLDHFSNKMSLSFEYQTKIYGKDLSPSEKKKLNILLMKNCSVLKQTSLEQFRKKIKLNFR